ncbi:acyltransferase family protein [Oceanospirillum sp. HFRX-1_2]
MSALAFRSDIQGLRAIAVIAVMAFHFNPAWLPGGFIGVDLFLVISGYLITSILLHKKEQTDYSFKDTLKYFYVSRFKRIAPAYFVMLVIVAFVAAVFFLPQDFSTFKKGLEKAAWFNSNNYFADFGDYFAPANHEQPLLHTWSLAVEIQFYLLAPFMVLLLPTRWLKWVFGGLLIGLTAIAEYRLRFLGIEQATYYSLYARLPVFFAGGLSALYVLTVHRDKSPAWISSLGILLILLAAIAQPHLGPFPGIAVLLPVVGGVLLLSFPVQGWAVKILSCKTLVWIGALSYSLYLWHWPVLAFLRYYTGAEVLSIEFSLLFVLLTLVLSIASYYGIELVFRSKKTHKKQALGWMFLAAVVFGTSQSMAKINAVFTPEELPIEYRRYADPATICHGKIIGDCLKGDLNSSKEILVLGDSHAAMLNHFFDYLGKELEFKARIITASSCVTIPAFDYERIAEWAQKSCFEQIQAASKYVRQTGTIFIAGVRDTQTRSKKFNTAIYEFLKNNQEKKIYLLSQVPRFENNPSRTRRFDSLGLNVRPELDPDYIVGNNVIKSLGFSLGNVEYIELSGASVFDSAPIHKGRLIYVDEHHLNEVGSLSYAEDSVDYFRIILGDKRIEFAQ